MLRLPICRCWLFLVVFVVLLFLSKNGNAAHSRRRPTRVVTSSSSAPHMYDRSITTFDPSGRLLQVEYSANAASRGSCAVGVLLRCCLRDKEDNPKKEINNHNHNPCLLFVVPAAAAHSAIHRVDDHLVVAATGLVGDTLHIVDQLRYWCQEFVLTHGEAPTVLEAAQQVATWQHERTRTGGQRPLGCAVLVGGADPCVAIATSSSTSTSSNNRNAYPRPELQLFRIGPGGGLEDIRYGAIGQEHPMLMKQLATLYPTLDNRTKQRSMPWIRKRLALLVMRDSSSSSEPLNQECCQVWTMEPALERRGQIKLSCFQNVTASSR